MKYWGALACVVCFAAQAGAQSAEVRVVVRSGALNRDARVRVHPSYAAVPEAVRKATARALQEAGLTVLTTERRQPPETLLLLTARCRRTWLGRWRCTEYAARLVDSETAEVLATATLNPLATRATRLSVIEESVRAGIARASGSM